MVITGSDHATTVKLFTVVGTANRKVSFDNR